MSQREHKNAQKRSSGRFKRLERQQKYGKMMQHYESNAPRVAMLLFGCWTVLWIMLGLLIPRILLWALFAWLLGAGTLGMAVRKVYITRRKTGKYLGLKKPLEELYRMNALDFEHAVAASMRAAGYENVRVTPSMGDGGIDILMERDGLRYGVQCKKYHPDSFIKIDLLRAFVYAYRKAGCDAGVYVTTAQYSAYAREEMATEGVSLIDGKGLAAM